MADWGYGNFDVFVFRQDWIISGTPPQKMVYVSHGVQSGHKIIIIFYNNFVNTCVAKPLHLT